MPILILTKNWEKKTAWNIPHHRSIWISLSILQCSFNVCSNIEIENKNLRIEFFPLCSTLFFSFFVKLDEKWYQWPEPVEQIILCQSLIYYKRLRSLLFSRSSLKTSFDTTDTVLRCGGKGEKRRRENNVKLFYRCETLLFSPKKVTTALPFYYYVVVHTDNIYSIWRPGLSSVL